MGAALSSLPLSLPSPPTLLLPLSSAASSSLPDSTSKRAALAARGRLVFMEAAETAPAAVLVVLLLEAGLGCEGSGSTVTSVL